MWTSADARAQARLAVPPDWILPLEGWWIVNRWRRHGSMWMRKYTRHQGNACVVWWNNDGESDELKITVHRPHRAGGELVFSTYGSGSWTEQFFRYEKALPSWPGKNQETRLYHHRGVQDARAADVETAMRVCDILLSADFLNWKESVTPGGSSG